MLGAGRPSDGAPVVFLSLFRLVLVVSAGLIVLLRWYFVDLGESYMAGYPAPRTYIARSSIRFADKAATNELRSMAADQIVNVRVRNYGLTQLVVQRISALKNDGSLDFAPPELASVIRGLPEADRTQVIGAAVDIAEKNYDRFASKSEQAAMIWDHLRYAEMPQANKNVVFQLLDALLLPTVADDAEMAERLREDVSSRVTSAPTDIRVGGILVQKGQLVTPDIAALLREQGYSGANVPWKYMSFVVISTFAWSFWVTWLGGKQESPPSNGEWVYITLLLLIDWVVQAWFGKWDVDSLSVLAMTGWIFLTLQPAFAFQIALGGGIIGYLLAFQGMTSMISVGFILCVVAVGASFIFMREASSRIMIWRNIFSLGLSLTCASLFVRWGLGLAVSWELVGTYLLLCALWSSLVVAVIPLWEAIFDIISPLRLLELSHQSQPLMKRLQLEAPGTYHHTVTVGTLAEAVADRLGMNGLLIKTGAYYHDIGKLKRPHYFVENQSFGNNIHDRITPFESAKMIKSHVTDGLKLADEYRLPRAIKDFIAEHHGRTCMTYFYKKALAAGEEEGGGDVDKADFCYPGPTPQHPETALLMLADSVEAALKGLKDPLAGRPELDKLVEDVINSKIMTGQFVDVDFTLKDLNSIRTAMVDVLMSMYHTREVKPLPKQEERKEPEQAARGDQKPEEARAPSLRDAEPGH
jgi:putative nucleotidyltransferase with HDIG domain